MGAVRNSNANEGGVSLDSLLQSALALQIEIFHRLKSIPELDSAYAASIFQKKKIKQLRTSAGELEQLCLMKLVSLTDIQEFIQKSHDFTSNHKETDLIFLNEILSDLEESTAKLQDQNKKLIDQLADKINWNRKLYKHLRAQAEERIITNKLASDTFADAEELSKSDLKKDNTQEFHYEVIEQCRVKLNLTNAQIEDLLTASSKIDNKELITQATEELNQLLIQKVELEIMTHKDNILKGLAVASAASNNNNKNSKLVTNVQIKLALRYFLLESLLNDLIEDLIFLDKQMLLRWHYVLPDFKSELEQRFGYSDQLNLDSIKSIISGYLESDLDINKGRFVLTQENLLEMRTDGIEGELKALKDNSIFSQLHNPHKILGDFFDQRINFIIAALNKIDDVNFEKNIQLDKTFVGRFMFACYQQLSSVLSPVVKYREEKEMAVLKERSEALKALIQQDDPKSHYANIFQDELDIPQNKNIIDNACEAADLGANTESPTETVTSKVMAETDAAKEVKSPSSNTTSYILGGVVVALTVASVLAFAGPLAPAVVGSVLLAIPVVKGIAGLLGLSAYTLGLTTLTMGVLTLGSLWGIVDKKIFGNAPSPAQAYKKINKAELLKEEQVPLLSGKENQSRALDVAQNRTNAEPMQKTESTSEKQAGWEKSKAAKTSLSKMSFLVNDSKEVSSGKYTNKYADYVTPKPGKKK